MWWLSDTAIWLGYRCPVVFARVVRRSASRGWTREPTFNGNVEHFVDWADPEHPVQWSMRRFRAGRAELEARFADPRYADLHKVRIRRPAAAQWYLDRLR
ncbi:MAG: hypothetical protein LH630_06155 [Actinomycetia bacterium]|nr:hypothetical protein [Actinomycetes bacterium]